MFDTQHIQSLENLHSSGVYTKRPVVIVRGQGAHLWDSEGKEYIDCVGGQGTANVGHANPAVADAIAAQAHTLISCPEMFYNDQRAALMDKLAEITGMPRMKILAAKPARSLVTPPPMLRQAHWRFMPLLSITLRTFSRKP